MAEAEYWAIAGETTEEAVEEEEEDEEEIEEEEEEEGIISLVRCSVK